MTTMTLNTPLTDLPCPRNEADLEDILTAPTPETVAAMRSLKGDVALLGAGGKMGPTLALLAQRSLQAAGSNHRVLCVSRFREAGVADRLSSAGIEVIPCDLLDREALAKLPEVPNILYLAGMKFGSSSSPALTWAMNCLLPAQVAERFRNSRIVALSTGNVYPFVTPESGGANESVPPSPIGEYAQSCLGRERMFEYISGLHGTPVTLVRLNYAADLRYGVLVDVAVKVYRRQPVDLGIGWANTLWQGDANGVLLRSFAHCSSPPFLLNLTGLEILSVRALAERFAALFGLPRPEFTGEEGKVALLNDARLCRSLFGAPAMPIETLIDWTAQWVRNEGKLLNKPTHFETSDGKF